MRFFYDKPELNSIIEKLNLSLLQFEKDLFRSINLLLQVFTESAVKINSGKLPKEVLVEARIKRSDILANWYEDRRNSFSFINTFNENLKETLHKRLMSLTS